MSQVLKDLQQSQQQFEQTLPVDNGIRGKLHNPQRGNGKVRLMWAIAVGLGLGVASHIAFSNSALTRSIEASITPTLQQLLILEDAPASEGSAVTTPSVDITFLPQLPIKALVPLPKFIPEVVEESSVNVKPIPSNVSKPVAVAKSTDVPVKNNHTTAKSTTTPNDDWSLPKLDLSKLSPELAGRISNVLDNPSDYSVDEMSDVDDSKLDHTHMSQLDKDGERYKGRLPAMNLQTHMYASNSKHRWVKINGKELQEGDAINSDAKLIEIAPRYVVIEFLDEKIKVPALYDWKG
ncbi:hypothetical protein A9264_08025 [Vibrio sp. UCD-FRSSP16_10]|uniref:general secretion pathway protein GspB n=1 Tax=unclassified Vibrio TaxID=2614977 RepID=UPI0007FFF484|nr:MULTISPECIES: general secretion pathway protein GspB [unclassified Vibrio]OBT07375.1 hypothetical protein A9260_08810 [Vibrio sp. UCD-FRSSP16_30]OBT12854.1 hypothetical protein A9264_08025 [Vibrio sp. UCD-FRSSP16_10]